VPRVLAFLLLLAPALAQSALAPLRDHPLTRQAQSYLEAARKALLAQESPVALNLQAGHTRLGYACTPEALCQSLPSSGSNLTLALVLTPFPFGPSWATAGPSPPSRPRRWPPTAATRRPFLGKSWP
jgi:outer membrane protein